MILVYFLYAKGLQVGLSVYFKTQGGCKSGGNHLSTSGSGIDDCWPLELYPNETFGTS